MKKRILSLVALNATAAVCSRGYSVEFNSKENSTHLQKPIELNFRQGEKVLVSPVGEVVGFDGRVFKIDGEAVVANTKANMVDLPFEINHGWDTAYGGKASGWFDYNSLEAREDGIYASLELNDLGKELVEGKYYRYVSPAFIMDRNKDDRSVLSLDSIGLVNTPNLVNKALNSKEFNDKMEILETEKNQAMETATETANELQETNKKLVEANTKALNAENDLKTQKEENKALRIDLAIEQNKILPKDKEFCKGLSDEQLESYISNNAGASLAKELGSELKPQEKNSKSRVEIAAAAGSKK